MEKYKLKLNNVRKYYKKNDNFLELYLNDYESYHIYFRLDYFKKSKVYKLIWFDFDFLETDIEASANYETIHPESIETIKETIAKISYENTPKEKSSNVYLTINSKCLNSNNFSISCHKFIPKQYFQLSDVIIYLFQNLPKKLEPFLYELLAEFTNSKTKYEYKEKFTFDLYNDDINKLFANQIIERGKKYYEETRVKFLEKIDDRFFAVVEGTEKYVVIVKYNEDSKELQLYCSCPCEFFCKHVYAVIMAIRNHENRRFFKISYRKPNTSILQRILEFDYELCLGVLEQNFLIINDYGQVERVPILDLDNKCQWEVLEDDEDEYLAKYIQTVISDNFIFDK